MTYAGFFARLALVAAAGTLALATVLAPMPAWAVRPFVTDDAEVVGHEHVQLETWMQVERQSFEHHFMFAAGPTPWLELTLGFQYGYHGKADGGGISGPIGQAKFAFRPLPENGGALGLIVGGQTDTGRGALTPEGWRGFSYLAYTHSVASGRVLFHANLGAAWAQHHHREDHWSPTFGLGVQAMLVGIVAGIAEVFYSDPLDAERDFGFQAGIRLVFSDNLQIDGTYGAMTARSGITDHWGTIGLRVVVPPKHVRHAERARTDAVASISASADTRGTADAHAPLEDDALH